MPISNRSYRSSPFTPAALLLAALVSAAVGLSFLPQNIAQSLRSAWRETLFPAQHSFAAISDLSATLWKKTAPAESVAAEQAQQKIADLTDELDRRTLQLQLAQTLATASPSRAENESYSDDNDTAPLLLSQLIPAHILGQQAKAFLKSHDLLDVGHSQGAAKDALVLDPAADLDLGATAGSPSSASEATACTSLSSKLLDQGRDTSVQTGHLVLAGSRVWGKVSEVGPHTCTVRRITDANYRDLVQLATLRDGKLQFSVRGVLQGVGQRLCKIEMVETTEPVAVNDLVFTADDGVLQSPLLYGKIVKLDRKPGDAHWQIWMEPAVKASAPPSRISVLKIELNPARVAEAQPAHESTVSKQ